MQRPTPRKLSTHSLPKDQNSVTGLSITSSMAYGLPVQCQGKRDRHKLMNVIAVLSELLLAIGANTRYK